MTTEPRLTDGAVKAKHVIFSAPMVRALIAGRKTMTRRLIKQPFDDGYYQGELFADMVAPVAQFPAYVRFSAEAVGGGAVRTENQELRYHGGDRLYVRESCAAFERPDLGFVDGVRFVADDTFVPIAATQQAADAWVALNHYNHKRTGRRGNLVPSIHMPRWASRLTLTVTAVRVERLQDISEADAIEEGIWRVNAACSDGKSRELWHGVSMAGNADKPEGAGPVGAYKDLWESLHNPKGWCADDNPDAWASNPWVAAISFACDRRNIDAGAA